MMFMGTDVGAWEGFGGGVVRLSFGLRFFDWFGVGLPQIERVQGRTAMRLVSRALPSGW